MELLSDIAFTDLYLSSEQSYLSGVQGEVNPLPVSTKHKKELQELIGLCESKNGTTDYVVNHNDVTYRVSKLTSVKSTTYVLRRMPFELRDVSKLGIHKAVIEKLLADKISGLIIISGSFGSGKTTTASAIVAERLSRFGGVAITIEDPPEMPLEGMHNNGVCYQTYAEKRGFSDALESVSRQSPDIIMLGEIRDPDTARQALVASRNGAVVICTIHADDVETSIERMFNFASNYGQNPNDAASMLSSGLLAVIHQNLNNETGKIEAQFLFFNESMGPKNLVLKRKFNQLGSEIKLQLNKLMSNI
jgi:twitching motility protein PilT